MTVNKTDSSGEASVLQPIGIVGLGRMGIPIALRLEKAGYELLATSRSVRARAVVEAQGIQTVESPAELAARARIILISVFDTAALENVVRGEDGLLASLQAGAILIDLGTSAIETTRQLADQVEKSGGDFIDSPVSGGTKGAAAGELTLLIGAKKSVLDRVSDVLGALGRINHMGGIGAGQGTKAINQLILGQTLVAVAEGLFLAGRLGLDRARVREALMGGFAESRVLLEHGLRMVEEDFEPGGSVAIFSKDLDIVHDLARKHDVNLSGLASAREQYRRARKKGFTDLDQAAIIKVYGG